MNKFFGRFWDCLLMVLFLAVVPFVFLFGIEIGLMSLYGYTLTLTELVFCSIANIIGYAWVLAMLE